MSVANVTGSLMLDRPLTANRLAYLKKLAATKRVYRDEKVLGYYSDPVRNGVELSLGADGEFFVGNDGMDPNDKSILDEDSPPGEQPSEWCPWEPNEAGTSLVVNNNRDYETDDEWLKYIVKKFLIPWGHTLNGEIVLVEDEEFLKITVNNNEVEVEGGEADDVKEAVSASCCGARCGAPPQQDNTYRVLDEKWNVLVQLREELVKGGVPTEAANKILAGSGYKCKMQTPGRLVEAATNLYKMLVSKNFDTPEAIKLVVLYLTNEQ